MNFPGGMEWVLIVLVIILLFGAKKIPELMKGIGRGMGEFKKGLRDVEDELKKASDETKKLDDEVKKSDKS